MRTSNIVQLIISVVITILGLIVALFGITHIGIIAAAVGILCTYCTIKEMRNQADW